MSLQLKVSSSSVTIPRNWNAIWKQQIPPRIGSMLWHLSYRCFHTRSCLVEEGLPIDVMCVHYEQLAELHIHSSFFFLPKSFELLGINSSR